MIDGGWRLLNHEKYKYKLSADDIRERDRIRKQNQRDRQKQKCPTQSGTKRDTPEMSESSNNTHRDVGLKEKERNTHTPTASVAERGCAALSLSGTKNQTKIRAVIDSEETRTSQSPDEIADRMVCAWRNYRSTPIDGFKYDHPIAFFESGYWLRPESWKAAQAGAKQEEKTKYIRDPVTKEIFRVRAD